MIKNSAFKNIYGSYAIKDLGGSSVEVSDCTFENCGGGIMLDSNSGRSVTPNPVTISGNTFTKVDVDDTTPENKVSTRGLLQIPSKGNYTNTAIILDGNTATNCGPTLRQLNQGIADNDVLSKNLKGDLTGLGGVLTYTEDSKRKEGGDTPAQPTVYTVKFVNADVADMKVVSGTEITLPTATKYGYTFNGWYDGSTKVSSPYKVTKDVTLTASWSYNYSGGSSSDPTYSVSTPSKTENGSVTVSPSRASYGTTVTITVDPDEGYELRKLQVIGPDGDEIALTKKADGTYTFKMPKGGVTVTAVFGCDGGAACPSKGFTDLDSDKWYHEYMDYAVEQGLLEGTSPTTMEPNATLTRAQLAQVLYNLEGKPQVQGDLDFTDVAEGKWYYAAILWANQEGVVDGMSPDTFAPNEDISRQDLALMLYRYAGEPETQGSLEKFQDAGKVGDWAEKAITWAVEEGIIDGMTPTTLEPTGTATRAQAAAMLQRFLEG